MGLPTIDVVVNKWKSRASGAGADWLAGIKRTDVSPPQAAVAAKDKWVAKMTSSEVHDRWANNLSLVTRQQWQAAAEAKGHARYTSGINASVDKYRQRMGAVLSHIQSGLDAIAGMPDVTLEDAVARSAAFIRHMAEFRRTS